MKVKRTYPIQSKKKLRLDEFRIAAKWIFLFAAYICPIINICTGGKAWSIIVIWSLRIIWTFLLSPDLVEYNRISQTSKLIVYVSVLLILIGTFLAPGWIKSVVPIVGFGGLIIIGILFFTDLDKQKQNMMPMLWVVFASLVTVIVVFIIWPDEKSWELVVLGSIAFALFVACVSILGKDIFREFKRRFHTK